MRLVINIVFALLTLTVSVNEVSSLKILGILPYEGKSHFFLFEPYLRELARRGHDVTVISHFPQKQAVKNYTDISLAGSVKILEDALPIERSYATLVNIIHFIIGKGTENCRQLLANKEVQDLWKRKANFDVVLVEQFNSDCSLGLAHKLGAPVVGLTSHTPMPWHYNRFGMPYNPSYVPFMFFGAGTKPTLYQRIEIIVFNAYFNTVYTWLSQRIDQNTLAEYFDSVPPLEELGKEIKLYLIYRNLALFGSSMAPQNVKEVGGYHVAAPKPLPNVSISYNDVLKTTFILKTVRRLA